MRAIFGNRLYLAIVGSHFVIDLFTGITAVLLAVLSVPLGLSNAQIGIALTLYMLANSLSQPFFGWFADRSRLHPLQLTAFCLLWMGAFFTAIAFTENWLLIVTFMVVGALGSGLFHPIGTAIAPGAYPGSANMGTALFFLFGQMGLAFGPIVGGLMFGEIGALGVLPIAGMALLPALFTWYLSINQTASDINGAVSQGATVSSNDWRAMLRWLLTFVALSFALLVAVRSSIGAVYTAFIPKLFEDRGWEPEIYGLLAGLVMLTAAMGNVIMGKWADRFGLRAVTVLSLLVSVPVGVLLLTTGDTLLIFVLVGLVGFLTGGQHSIFVVHAQSLLPVRKGFASGLILGFTFGSGAIGTWLCGIAGDLIGLQQAMIATALLGALAALLALTLPGRPSDNALEANQVPPVPAGQPQLSRSTRA